MSKTTLNFFFRNRIFLLQKSTLFTPNDSKCAAIPIMRTNVELDCKYISCVGFIHDIRPL